MNHMQMLAAAGGPGGTPARAWANQTTLSATGWSTADVYGLAWNGTVTVAVGGVLGTSSQFATSADGGATWTSRSSPWGANTCARGVVWGGTVFCAIGEDGKIATSPDGITWTNRTSLPGTTWGTSAVVRGIVWTGAQFVVIGDDNKVATSPDGTTWTYRTGLRSVWDAVSPGHCLAWNGTTLVAGGEFGRIATSADGITWTNRTSLSGTSWGSGSDKQVYSLAWDGVVFLAVGGQDGFASVAGTSPDGTTWTYRSSLATAFGSTNGTSCVIWEEGQFIAGGSNGKLATSPDGTTWTAVTDLSSTSFSTTDIYCIGYGFDSFTVGGASGKLGTYLTNGIFWAASDVVLLLRMEGANNGTTFTEDTGRTMTRVGTPVTSTAQSAIGASSMYNSGGNNYLSTPNDALLAVGTSEYTIMAKVRVATIVDFTSIIDNQGQNTSNLGWLLDINSAEKFRFTSWSPTYLTGTTTVVANTWYDVMITERNGTIRLFVDGKLEDTDTTATNFSSTSGSLFVGWGRNSVPIIGYLDDVVLIRKCLQVLNFAPRTTAFLSLS